MPPGDESESQLDLVPPVLVGLDGPTIEIRPYSAGASGTTGDGVIIDVCRAFSVAAIALANGAGAIVMVDDLARALKLSADDRPAEYRSGLEERDPTHLIPVASGDDSFGGIPFGLRL